MVAEMDVQRSPLKYNKRTKYKYTINFLTIPLLAEEITTTFLRLVILSVFIPVMSFVESSRSRLIGLQTDRVQSDVQVPLISTCKL